MIYLACLLAGIAMGAGAMYWFRLRAERAAQTPADLAGTRWERGTARLTNDAIRHLRRHYPTHDLVTNVPFLDLVHTRGARMEAVVARCRPWTAAVVMIDKRTGDGSRVLLWNDDADLQEKAWILRRVGYKVVVVERDGDEDGLLQAMAA